MDEEKWNERAEIYNGKIDGLGLECRTALKGQDSSADRGNGWGYTVWTLNPWMHFAPGRLSSQTNSISINIEVFMEYRIVLENKRKFRGLKGTECEAVCLLV